MESKSNVWNIRQLVLLARKKLKKLNDDSNGQFLDKQTLIKFLDYLELIPDLSSLLTTSLTQELQSDTKRELFSLLVKKLEEISLKTTSVHAFEILEPFEATLTFWKEIFCLIRNTNESLVSRAQVEFMKTHDKLPDKLEIECFGAFEVLEPIFTAVITSLLNQVAKTQLTLTSDFMAVVLLGFAYAGLSNLSELNLISEEIKLHLVYLLLSPFSKMGQSLSSKLPKNVTKVGFLLFI